MGQFIKTRRVFSNPEHFFSFSEPDGYQMLETDDGIQHQFLMSGILTVKNDILVDVFLVGGGGAGKYGGGGGGYTKTFRAIKLTAGIEYEIVIGEGGVAATSSSTYGTEGGKTSAFGIIAKGAGIAGPTTSTSSTARLNGGPGGSGGGGGSGTAGDGGSNGASGESITDKGAGGAGQGYTTRAFGEENGELYAAGGGGCPGSQTGTVGIGGEPGAGDGIYETTSTVNVSAAPNTGSGGGGTYKAAGRVSNGGSGIVIIRKAKDVERQYLYYAGDEHDGFTNGWIGEGRLSLSSSGSSKRANITRESNQIVLNNSGGEYAGVIRTSLGVDMTPYKTLVFEGTFTRGGSVARNLTAAVWSTIGTYYATESQMLAYYQMKNTGTVNRIELDVSNIDGLGYPGIGVTMSSAKITACYLEPKDESPKTWRYLYSAGNEYESITGGWGGNNKKSNSTSGATAREPSIDRSNTAYIIADNSPSYGGMFITQNQIDLTPYKELVFDGEFLADADVAQNVYAGAWSTIGTYYQVTPDAFVGSNMEATIKRIVVPVADVNVPCYIGLGLTRVKATIRACYLIPKDS